MEVISPTRMSLLQKKQEYKQVIIGVELLRNKRDALLKEFFSTIAHLSALRNQLELTAYESTLSFISSVGFEGKEKLLSYTFGHENDWVIDLYEKNLWGVRIPELKEGPVIEKTEFGEIGISYHIENTRNNFIKFIKLALRVLPEEIKLKRLGKEIKRVSRKINYLEKYVLPQILYQIKFIYEALEEIEREDIFRLKRIKIKNLTKR
ncbi:MAG: V-type ATP synthase subunit D [Candidatus Omnitrophica bacterium]|nr:V-type ATP synthase subunit D [Candidatus Omnitrophota bacterium]